MADCTCTFDIPRRESATMRRPFSSYAIYLDEWHDNTVVDTDCPFHGDGGTMVVAIQDLSILVGHVGYNREGER